MMLLPRSEFDDTMQLHMVLLGYVACDSENKKVFLYRSAGRRKAGRPARYWIIGPAPDAMVTAHSDDEAIGLMNAKLKMRDVKAEDQS